MAYALRSQFDHEYTPPTIELRPGVDDAEVPRLPPPPFAWRRRAHRWAFVVSLAVNVFFLGALVRVVVGR